MESNHERIPLQLRQERAWACGSLAACDFASALEAGTAPPRFVLGNGWRAIQLHRAVDPQTNEVAWWAEDVLATIQSYAELHPDGSTLILMLQCEEQDATRRFTSTTYGYDLTFLGTGEAIELTGRMFADHPLHDRTAAFQDVFGRVARVEREEAALDTGDPTDRAWAAAGTYGSSLPGFGQINFRGTAAGPGGDQLRQNEINFRHVMYEYSQSVLAPASTPVKIQLGRSNTCNFKCVYCGDHRIGNSIPRTKLAPEVWSKLERLIPRSTLAAFHGVSEFFLDPEFFEIVQLCADAHVGLGLNTNGSVCTPRHLAVVQDYPAPLDLFISVDAATPEMFRRLRGWDFFRLLENIRQYQVAVANRVAPTIFALSFVITRSNVHEMAPFVFLAKALGADTVSYLRLLEYSGLNWVIADADGQPFDYRAESTPEFVEVFQEQLAITKQLAECFHLNVIMPPPIPATEGAGLPVLNPNYS